MRGRNTVPHWFSMHSVPSFLVFMFWSSGMRLAVSMSVQDEFICVCLVMPRCMFSMQLFLSEIVKSSPASLTLEPSAYLSIAEYGGGKFSRLHILRWGAVLKLTINFGALPVGLYPPNWTLYI